MADDVNSVKGSLERAINLLKASPGGVSESETKGLAARARSVLGVLVRNERKIWLRTKKGRELLAEFDAASRGLIEALESGAGVGDTKVALDEVEQMAKRLEEEIRKRSMVVT